ncbi:hypothetical protein BKP42_44510 [Rhodococcus erythropolis]|nr:hypothetical protein BKP42_44510 [Rhodococcus erythropolis]
MEIVLGRATVEEVVRRLRKEYRPEADSPHSQRSASELLSAMTIVAGWHLETFDPGQQRAERLLIQGSFSG